MMDERKCYPDSQDEVRKLQEKVRELEFQLSQKALLKSSNGIGDSISKLNDPNDDEGLVPVLDVDLSSKTWLVSSRADARSDAEVIKWLARDFGDGSALYVAICNAEQDRRKNIDSRTFTRPKKRTGRPSLELLESLSMSAKLGTKLSWAIDTNKTQLDNMTCSLLESTFNKSVFSNENFENNVVAPQLSISNKKQKVGPQLEKRRGSLVISENDLQSLVPPKIENGNSLDSKFEDNVFPSIEGVVQKFDTIEKDDVSDALLESADFTTSLIDSALMDGGLMDTFVVNPKVTLGKVHPINKTFSPSPTPEFSSRKTLQEVFVVNQSSNNSLNQTFVKGDEDSPINCSILDSTFCVEPNGGAKVLPSLARSGSADSDGADDDQLSSASESSHTSNTRLMSVGDVQHIARLQEQSLVMSTPSHHRLPKELHFSGEDKFSPICQMSNNDFVRSSGSSETQTGGYGSDRSSRSPQSSLHSSPAGSPFGSNTVLAGSNQTQVSENKLVYHPNGALPRKTMYGLVPPGGVNKVSGIRPPAAVAATAHVSRPTARSGLRPPSIRTGVSTSNLPRPAATGIPRPSSLSRIPPPKIRSGTSRKGWTDECF